MIKTIICICFLLGLVGCASTEQVITRTDTLRVFVPALAETIKVQEIHHPIWSWAGVGARVESVYVNVPGRTVFVKSRPETLKIIHTDTIKLTKIERAEQTKWEWIKDRAFFVMLGLIGAVLLILLLRFKLS